MPPVLFQGFTWASIDHVASWAQRYTCLVFLIYIDDITRISLSEGTKLLLYADDMLLYRKIDHPEDYVALQMDINSVNNWIKGNYLTFNTSKCKYMLISRRRQHHCDPPELLLDNFSLERVECFKYLGILLNSDLPWSNHITSICTKARKLLGLLYRRFYKHAEPCVCMTIGGTPVQ